MMKKYFVKTNAYNGIALVGEDGKGYWFDEQVFSQPLRTVEDAKTIDCSLAEYYDTADELAEGEGYSKENIYDFEELTAGEETEVYEL